MSLIWYIRQQEWEAHLSAHRSVESTVIVTLGSSTAHADEVLDIVTNLNNCLFAVLRRHDFSGKQQTAMTTTKEFQIILTICKHNHFSIIYICKNTIQINISEIEAWRLHWELIWIVLQVTRTPYRMRLFVSSISSELEAFLLDRSMAMLPYPEAGWRWPPSDEWRNVSAIMIVLAKFHRWADTIDENIRYNYAVTYAAQPSARSREGENMYLAAATYDSACAHHGLRAEIKAEELFSPSRCVS